MIIGGWRGPGWRIVTGDREQAGQVRDWIGSTITGTTFRLTRLMWPWPSASCTPTP